MFQVVTKASDMESPLLGKDLDVACKCDGQRVEL